MTSVQERLRATVNTSAIYGDERERASCETLMWETADAMDELTDKALRFDLDEAGITSREAAAVELVELRARTTELEALAVTLAKFAALPMPAAECACDSAALRGTLQELRARLHVAGRRPEECYEMSMIDDALARHCG